MISLPLLRPTCAPCTAPLPVPSHRGRHRRLLRLLPALHVAVGLSMLASLAWADTAAPLPAAVRSQVIGTVRAAMGDTGDARVEVLPGQLDARLRLAPCQQIETSLPPGSPPWGRTRVSLRCTSGPVAWQVYLPVQVQVWRKAVVSATALAAGAELSPGDLQMAEVDVAASSVAPFTDPARLTGRRLVQAVVAGTALRADNLRVRQWFAAGDKVTLVYKGEGFEASTDGQALNAGVDGQSVRVRVASGQVVTGLPTGENRVEVRS
jgi:flagella basal body P-ring formation protein FlgA